MMVYFRRKTFEKKKTSLWYLKKKEFLCKKCPNTEFFLVQIRKNTDEKKLHKVKIKNANFFVFLRTKKNSVLGHFPSCEYLKKFSNFDTETSLSFLVLLTFSQVFKNGICFFTVSNLSMVQYLFHYSVSYPLLHQLSPIQHYTEWKVSKYGVISGPYFFVFSSNTGKDRPEITPYLDTFHAVLYWVFFSLSLLFFL